LVVIAIEEKESTNTNPAASTVLKAGEKLLMLAPRSSARPSTSVLTEVKGPLSV